MRKENKNCGSLEQKALAEEGTVHAEWTAHAENCSGCRSRLALINKMNKAGREINKTIGIDRFEVIRQAVAVRNCSVKNQVSLVLKLAAGIAVVSGIILLLRSFLPVEDTIISSKDHSVIISGKTDLAWDYNQETEGLKYKMNKLKRKVYFGDIEDGDNGSFDIKYQSIKNQALRLKSPEQINVY